MTFCCSSSFFFSFLYNRIDMNPFLLSPRPGSELCPLFLRPGGGHKGKRNKELCSLFLRPGGGHKGERNNDGAGGVEKGSKGLTLVNF